MKKGILTVLAALSISCAAFTDAGAVSWVDWKSPAFGTLTVGSSTVNVTLTGSPWGFSDGDIYYNNGSTGGTSPSGTYGGLTPSDLIHVYTPSLFNLVFDSPVVDPYIALVSVGSLATAVTYNFNSPFTVISSGPNLWGYGGYSVIGNNFTGTEYNGVLKFSGTFSSLTFSVSPAEYWHGFNFGVADAAPVPEPSTLLLLGGGLGALAFARRLKKRKM